MSQGSYPDRNFQLWDYSVSHSQLVIRSPGDEDTTPNVDFHFRGVMLLGVPTQLRGLKLTDPTDGEVEAVRGTLAHRVEREWVRVLVSAGTRHLIVASHLEVSENTMPVMQTVLEHTSDDPNGER